MNFIQKYNKPNFLHPLQTEDNEIIPEFYYKYIVGNFESLQIFEITIR